MIGFDDLGPVAQEALARLTEQQRIFVKHLFEGLSQTEAYKRAYPENKSPSGSACELAKKKDIRIVLEELRTIAARQFSVDEEKIIGAYARLAFGDIRDFYDRDGRLIPVHRLPRHVADMIQSFEQEDIRAGSGQDAPVIGTLTKIRLINRKEALDSLARTQGLFVAAPKKKSDTAKVVRFPEPVSAEKWQEKHAR